MKIGVLSWNVQTYASSAVILVWSAPGLDLAQLSAKNGAVGRFISALDHLIAPIATCFRLSPRLVLRLKFLLTQSYIIPMAAFADALLDGLGHVSMVVSTV